MFPVNHKRNKKKSRRRRTLVAQFGINPKANDEDEEENEVNEKDEKEREKRIRNQQLRNSYFHRKNKINKESDEWKQMQDIISDEGWLSFRADLGLAETFIGPGRNKYKVDETKEGDVWYTRILAVGDSNSDIPKAEEGDCWWITNKVLIFWPPKTKKLIFVHNYFDEKFTEAKFVWKFQHKVMGYDPTKYPHRWKDRFLKFSELD